MIAINEYVERKEKAKQRGLKVEDEMSSANNDEMGEEEVTTDSQRRKEGTTDEEDQHGVDDSGQVASRKQKRKKKKKKKEKQESTLVKAIQEPKAKPAFRGLLDTAFTDYYVKYEQTNPPTIPITSLFGEGTDLPTGVLQEYAGSHSYRISSTEARARDTLQMDTLYTKMRQAAEVHRQVRAYSQSLIHSGMVLADFCEALENNNRELVDECGLQRGIAFPTGVSLNHVAAHYTPNTGDNTVFQYDDVMKVDFGVQIEGCIVDSAWTVAMNPRYDPLLEAVRQATDAGLAAAGIDARICDVSASIQEVMESYEVELDGKTYPVKAIRNLSGHAIEHYHIHGAKSIPIVKNACPESLIMEEGEIYAIETFGTTGRGYVVEEGECSHYLKNFDAPYIPLRLQSSKKLLNHINKTFGTLGFCRRWLDRPDGGSATLHGQAGKQERYMGALKNLCDVGMVMACPPLVDVKGSYSAQYEHTIMLRPTVKEVVTRGLDY